MVTWQPTHRLTWPTTGPLAQPGRTTDVLLDDEGRGYQKDEWEHVLPADFELWPDGWRYQGQPFPGRAERLTTSTTAP